MLVSYFPVYFDDARLSLQNLELSQQVILPIELKTKITIFDSELKKEISFEESNIIKATSSIGQYNYAELQDFFHVLRFHNPNFRLSFLLNSGEHAINMSNDHPGYSILDSNSPDFEVTVSDNPDTMPQQILISFCEGDPDAVITFELTVFCSKTNKNAVKVWVKEIKEDKDWVTLHDTAGKENVTDSLGYNIFYMAARSGDMDLINQLIDKSPILMRVVGNMV